MAGYSKLYCVGEKASGGIGSIHFQILVSTEGRQQLDVHYVNRALIQLGGVRSILPRRADDPQALLDACIAFYPDYFKDCGQLMVEVGRQLRRVTRLDFARPRDIPVEWSALRTQALPGFRKLDIFEATLRALPGVKPQDVEPPKGLLGGMLRLLRGKKSVAPAAEPPASRPRAA